MGDAWDPDRPTLRARNFRPKREPGKHFCMQVEYGEEAGSNGTTTPQPDYRTTTSVEAESASESVKYDVTGMNQLGEDGTTKLLTAITFRVRQYTSALPNLGALHLLCDEPKLNESDVVLPNLFGTSQGVTVAAGQLLYKGFRITREGDLFLTEHELLWRRDWRWFGVIVDESMRPIASYIPQNIYDPADFVAVFG